MSERLDEGRMHVVLADLLERATAGDETALDELLKLVGPCIRQRARHYLRTRTQLRRGYGSDDFQQLALLDLARRIRNRQVRPDSCGEFIEFVSIVVRDKISRAARSELAERRDVRRTVSLGAVSEPLSGSDQDPEQLAIAKEVFAVARRELTAEERRICELYLEGTPWRAIAAEVGGTENSVRHKWRRALSRLRRQLTPPLGGLPSTPKLMTAMRTDSLSIRR